MVHIHTAIADRLKRGIALMLAVALCMNNVGQATAITYDAANSEFFDTVDDLGLSGSSDSISLRFGGTLGESLRFNRAIGRFVLSNDLDVQGTISGSALTIMGTAGFSGSVMLENGTTLSGSVLRGFGLLADCDNATNSKLLWDATTGRFSCGTDQGGGGGLALSDADARYVKKSGDTMTGKLVLNRTSVEIRGSGTVIAHDPNDVVLIVKGTGSQTGNLQNWVSNNDTMYINISANGTFNALGNAVFGDSDSDSLTFFADVNSNINPDGDNAYQLGNSSNRWSYGYFNMVDASYGNFSNVTAYNTNSTYVYADYVNATYDIYAGNNVSANGIYLRSNTSCYGALQTDSSGYIYCGSITGDDWGSGNFSVSNGSYSETIYAGETLNITAGSNMNVVVSPNDTVNISLNDDISVNNVTASHNVTANNALNGNYGYIAYNLNVGSYMNSGYGIITNDLNVGSNLSVGGYTFLNGGQLNIGSTGSDAVYVHSGNWTFYNSPIFTMNGGPLRVRGTLSGITLYATRSFSGAGLTDCDNATNSKLLWDATTGRFSCGTDQSGSTGGSPYTAGQGLTLSNENSFRVNSILTGSLLKFSTATGSLARFTILSGSVVKADRTLASSGTLSVEGDGFFGTTLGDGNHGLRITASSSNTTYIDFYENTTKNANIYMQGSTDSLIINDTGVGNTAINPNAGNVGIGNTAPKTKLSINGVLSGVTLYATRSFSGAGLTDCDNATSSKLLWDATTGRFSCGTDQSGGGSLTAGQGLSLNGSSLRVNSTLSGTLLRFFTVSGSTVFAKDTLASSGTLTVRGNSVFGASDSNSHRGISISASTSNISYIDFNENTTKTANLYWNGSTDQFIVNDAGVGPTIINPTAGNVGIGTTAPTSKFSVVGTTTLSGGMLLYSNGDMDTPAANYLAVYAKELADRQLLKVRGPSGIDYALQPSLFQNSIATFFPASGTTAGNVFGWAFTSAGTVSHPALASTNMLTQMRRTRWQSTTVANGVGGIFTNTTVCWRGNAAGLGGFFFFARFGQATNTNGARAFVGLSARASHVVAVEPNSDVNMVGMGYDAADSSAGNWRLFYNDGSGTASEVDLGSDAPRDTTTVYDLFIFAAPNGSTIGVRILNLTTGAVVYNGTLNTDLPTSTTFLRVHAGGGPAATAVAQNFELNRLYLETDQ